jgi:6-phosphogluconolactonase
VTQAEFRVEDDVAGAFADAVIREFSLHLEPVFSMALSGGETARRCYERLAAESVGRIDWRRVHLYWGDERCVGPDSPDSNYRLAREALIERVTPVGAIYPMDCEVGPGPYETRLRTLGGLDLVHLGLGDDGHTASLFAESPALLADPDFLVVMNEDPLGHNPHRRMTLTFTGLAKSRVALFTVEGATKRAAFARVHDGDLTAPAANVTAGKIMWLVDPAAASHSVPRGQALPGDRVVR